VRGGTSFSEVVIDEEEIIYPKVTSPHLLLVMSQEALEEHGSQLRPGGTVIIDSTEVEGEPQVEGRVIRVPITRLARERLRAVAANMVALGVLGGATGVISKGELIEALRAHAPAERRSLGVGLGRGGEGEGGVYTSTKGERKRPLINRSVRFEIVRGRLGVGCPSLLTAS